VLKASVRLRKILEHAWWWWRQVSGDAAYELYLQNATNHAISARSRKDGRPILSRQEFYLDSLRRKYSGVNRCC
jgi:uncharacterized short protein YbdD (DUF466 family)